MRRNRNLISMVLVILFSASAFPSVAFATKTATPIAALVSVKTQTIIPGQPFQLKISAISSDQTSYWGITLKSILPAGVTCTSLISQFAEKAAGASCSIANGGILCTASDIYKSGSIGATAECRYTPPAQCASSLNFQTTVVTGKPALTSGVGQDVAVSCNQPTPTPQATATPAPTIPHTPTPSLTPSSPLIIRKTAPISVSLGGTATYYYVAENSSSSRISKVRVADFNISGVSLLPIDPVFTYSSANGADCSFVTGERSVICNIGDLEPGQTKPFSISFNVPYNSVRCDDVVMNQADITGILSGQLVTNWVKASTAVLCSLSAATPTPYVTPTTSPVCPSYSLIRSVRGPIPGLVWSSDEKVTFLDSAVLPSCMQEIRKGQTVAESTAIYPSSARMTANITMIWYERACAVSKDKNICGRLSALQFFGHPSSRGIFTRGNLPRYDVFLFDNACVPLVNPTNQQLNSACPMAYSTLTYQGDTPLSLMWGSETSLQKVTKVRQFNFLESALPWHTWKASGETPLVVYDPSHQGNITSSDQLFGGNTFGGKHNSDGTRQVWESGYEALATLDSNGDSEISGGELQSLGLWFDYNQDAVSQPGEVQPIAETGVTKLFYVGPSLLADGSGLEIVNGFEVIHNGVVEQRKSVDWFTQGAETAEALE